MVENQKSGFVKGEQATPPDTNEKVKVQKTGSTNDILTVIFIFEILVVFWNVRHDVQLTLKVLGSLVGVYLLITIFKKFAVKVGSFMSNSLLNTSWTPPEDRAPLQKYVTMKKFKDQFWQFMIHLSMSIAEYYLIFFDAPENPESNYFDQPRLCWSHGGREHSDAVQMFYVVQLSIWIVTCFSHRFIEARHKDYYQMYILHIATIGLITASWIAGYLRIGVLVLFIHDTSDVPLDLMKILNYLKVQGRKGFFLVEIAFVTNLVTWAYFRLYLYPTKALYSAMFESIIEVGVTPEDFWDMPMEDKFYTAWNMPGHNISNILLLLLQILHIFWFFLLLRILFKLVSGTKAHKIGEEEYEGHSTDNDE
jgi:ceramide synthetase